jgi:proteasome alpha subunit
LKFKDGVVLIVDKRIASRLMEPKSIEKIFKIDHHIGCATSGLVADARILVDQARVIAQVNKITYDEEMSVEELVKRICDYKQNYTQYGGVRPFGTALFGVRAWTAKESTCSRPTRAERLSPTRRAASVPAAT